MQSREKVCAWNELVWIEFVLVSTLVFDEHRIVLTIMRILFFMDRMHPAPVLTVTMCMRNLCPAFLDETSANLRYTIRRTYVDVECIKLMLNRG